MKKQVKSIPSKQPVKPVHTAKALNYLRWFPWIAALAGFLLYMNTIEHGFVLDDQSYITKNILVQQGFAGIPKILTTPWSQAGQENYSGFYRPLPSMLFAMEWQVSPNNPVPGHLINILLFSLIGFLLYDLLRRWMPGKHPALLLSMALLFIAHPLNTEVVANIKSGDELLRLLFGILALRYYFVFAQDNQLKNLLLGSLFLFLSLLSKESSVTFLAIIPLSIYFFNTTERRQYISIFVSLLIVSAIYFGLRYSILHGITGVNTIMVEDNSLVAAQSGIERIATSIVLVGLYIKAFIFPHPLAYDHSLNSIPLATLTDYRFWLSFATIAAMGIYALKNIRKKDAASFGLLFFGITVSVTANIFFLLGATWAERFMFVPSVGLCIVVILFLERALKFSSKNHSSVFRDNKIFFTLMSFVLIAFSFKTITRNTDWKDNLALFTADKDNNPNSFRTQYAYAITLYKQQVEPLPDNDPQKAFNCREVIGYAEKSIAIYPNLQNFQLLASCYHLLREYNKELDVFEKGLAGFKNLHNGGDAFKADLINFYINGINAYYYLGNYNKGVETARDALKIAPENAALWNVLGLNLTAIDDRKNAMEALMRSYRLDSTNLTNWEFIGNLYYKNNDVQAALHFFTKTFEKDNKNLEAINNIGSCYCALKQYDKALEFYDKAMQLDPNSKLAIGNIALTYSLMGNAAKTAEYNRKLQSLP